MRPVPFNLFQSVITLGNMRSWLRSDSRAQFFREGFQKLPHREFFQAKKDNRCKRDEKRRSHVKSNFDLTQLLRFRPTEGV